MTRKVTKADATRKKHLKDCAGYEDCTCFSSVWSHADIYKMQQRIEKLRSALLALPARSGGLLAQAVERAIARDDIYADAVPKPKKRVLKCGVCGKRLTVSGQVEPHVKFFVDHNLDGSHSVAYLMVRKSSIQCVKSKVPNA